MSLRVPVCRNYLKIKIPGREWNDGLFLANVLTFVFFIFFLGKYRQKGGTKRVGFAKRESQGFFLCLCQHLLGKRDVFGDLGSLRYHAGSDHVFSSPRASLLSFAPYFSTVNWPARTAWSVFFFFFYYSLNFVASLSSSDRGRWFLSLPVALMA